MILSNVMLDITAVNSIRKKMIEFKFRDAHTARFKIDCLIQKPNLKYNTEFADETDDDLNSRVFF